MTFKELQKICDENFGTSKLSDIALELGVTPQVVSNWKSRNTVPYKYVKKVRKKIRQSAEDKQNRTQGYGFNPAGFVSEALNSDDGFKLLFIT